MAFLNSGIHQFAANPELIAVKPHEPCFRHHSSLCVCLCVMERLVYHAAWVCGMKWQGINGYLLRMRVGGEKGGYWVPMKEERRKLDYDYTRGGVFKDHGV